MPLEWTVEHDGEYRGTLRPRRSRGCTQIKVDARRATARTSARRRRTCACRPATASTSTRRCARRCCKRIAEETGGRFFTPADAAALPEAISYSGRGVTVVEERELWDMPIVLLLLLGAIGAEWALRRTRGLA